MSLVAGFVMAAGCGTDGTDVAANGATTNGAAREGEAGPADAVALRRAADFVATQYSRTDVRHAFSTRFGEEVDCVAAAAQPGLGPGGIEELRDAEARRPVLPVTTTPTVLPAVDGTVDDSGRLRSCPPDSVPILRTRPEQLALPGGLDEWLARAGRKGSPATTSAGGLSLPQPRSADPPAKNGYSYATGQINLELGAVRGAMSILSVYHPILHAGAFHSLSQIWLSTAGAQYPCSAPNCEQTLEAGWIVDSALFGDHGAAPHLFVYATRDGYGVTGCYDLVQTCSINGRPATGNGFVMFTSSPYMLGQVLSAGTVGSAPPEVKIKWLTLGPGIPFWYLYVNDSAVGYIPYSYFRNGQGGTLPLSTGYTTNFIFGGEVDDPSTASQMGSGQFAAQGFKQAAYHQGVVDYIDTMDGSGDLLVGSGFPSISQTDPSLYTATNSVAAANRNWGIFLYYGGPG